MKRTFWRVPLGAGPSDSSNAVPIRLTTNTGHSPRLGPDYLLYVCDTPESGESLWKFADGTSARLWDGGGAQILGAPAVSPDGRQIALSARGRGKSLLWVMRADGTDARIVNHSLDAHGSPAWAPDGRSLLVAAGDPAFPRLWRVPADGAPPVRLTSDYSTDPAWAPDGGMVVYSGAEVGPEFSLRAVSAGGSLRALPPVTLPRGSRRIAFLPGERRIVLLRGNLGHRDVWAVDVETGAERRLTNLAPDFDARDFDVSADGKELILERVQENSEVVLIELPRR